MAEMITCPSCKTDIDLGKLSEEKYKHKLEAQYQKDLEIKTEEMRKKAQEFAEQKRQEQAKKDEVEMTDLKNRLKEQEKAAEEMRKNELEMRKKTRELEEKEKNIELDMQRKLDEELKKKQETMEKLQDEAIKKQVQEASKIKDEEFRKKELEFLKQQDQLKRSLDDAKRKAEQGSQQIQWDIQEEDLKQMIQMSFPIDSVDDVPTWVKWADLIQTVKNTLGAPAGIIVWESKNTKSWQESWIMKLKEDSLKVHGNIAILVTAVLPKWIDKFGMHDDVMVCLPEYAILVSGLLRDKLLSVAKVETSMQWKDIKMEMLYKYLSSNEFSSKIGMMVDVFAQLKTGIDSERRAMEKNWKKREKDLERATFAVTGMYWELESLMWQALPGSERLELDSWEE